MPPTKFWLNPTYGLGGDVFEEILDSPHSPHLGYENRTIKGILNLHDALMPKMKFQLNLTYGSGDVKKLKTDDDDGDFRTKDNRPYHRP